MKAGCLIKYVPLCAALLVLAVCTYVRIRLLAVPLERDEGEFAYIGQLLLKGIPPFTGAYTMKLPGVSMLYALFMNLFGQTPAGIHAGLLIVNGICIFLVYLLTKQLVEHNAALLSCSSYAVMSLSSSVYGLFAHATHFVVLFVLSGLLLLLRFIEKKQILWLVLSGFCFGLAIIMKQHAVLLMTFAFLYLLWQVWMRPCFEKKSGIAATSLFLFGAIIPYALIVLWVVHAGSFDNFWFWTVQYAREYATGQTIASGWANFSHSFSKVVKLQFPLWLLAAFGCILLFSKKKCCEDRLFVVGYFVFSCLAVSPGLFFREHYFILLLPAVALLIGVGLRAAGMILSFSNSPKLTTTIQICLLIPAVVYGFSHERDTFFLLSPVDVSRVTYGFNPFPESLRIADYIKKHTTTNDAIAVIGSEPEVLFYADRVSATGHIYMYGLMEDQPNAEQMQLQMIREIETSRPAYIVFVNVSFSWLVQESSVNTLLTWRGPYLSSHYERVGVIDIGQNGTNYVWDAAAAAYTPVSQYFITVFKRKNGI